MIKKLLAITILGMLLSSNSFAGWFDKDKIIVTKCYDLSKYKNFSSEKKALAGTEYDFTKWQWELNLKTKQAIRTTILKGKLSLDQFPINIITEEYVIVKNTSGIGSDFQFDLLNELYIIDAYGVITLQCKFK